MIKKFNSNEARLARHARVRKKVSGTPECPRLCVFRSRQNIYAQIIDDTAGTTLAAASSLEGDLKGSYGGNKEAAKAVEEKLSSLFPDADIQLISGGQPVYYYMISAE